MKKRNLLVPDIPVMILCGGKGTRLRDVTEVLPKPMVPIGEQPILWHIMKCYAAFGVKRFILCLGYKSEAFIDYFLNYHIRNLDSTIRIGREPEVTIHGDAEDAGWEVTLARTGLESATGKRVAVASKYLKDTDEDFFLTYGDGLSDVNIADLYRHHRSSKKLLTVTAVHAPARFGELKIEKNEIFDFNEKTAVSAGYINGGFMVLNRDFLTRYLSPDRDEFLEQAPILTSIKDRQMNAFRHEGFWQCMDTPREFSLLNDLWNKKKTPWTRFWGK